MCINGYVSCGSRQRLSLSVSDVFTCSVAHILLCQSHVNQKQLDMYIPVLLFEFSSLTFALCLLFLHETKNHCSVICRYCELNNQFLSLQFCCDFKEIPFKDTRVFSLDDQNFFEPLFMVSHINSKERHGWIILVSIEQLHVSSFNGINSVI